MRPRLIGRGNFALVSRKKSFMICFNEAPTYRSGKYALCIITTSTSKSFNEAPTYRSGKYAGSSARAGTSFASFNEAPTYRSGKLKVITLNFRPIPASMRPRLIGRGNHRGVPRFSSGGCASMRPRLIGRGNGSLRRCALRCSTSFNEAPTYRSGKYFAESNTQSCYDFASMRPRLIGRGNTSRPVSRAYLLRLQ